MNRSGKGRYISGTNTIDVQISSWELDFSSLQSGSIGADLHPIPTGRREPQELLRNSREPLAVSAERKEMADECTHLEEIKVTGTNKRVCEECIKSGDTWVHLRMCLQCGSVGCCDSSKNQHATKHFHHTKHPLMRSIEPGEAWVWCYVDEISPGELRGNTFVPMR